jgi:hypothetical protein
MATTNNQPTTRNGGPAAGDPQAASENDMNSSQTDQTGADGSSGQGDSGASASKEAVRNLHPLQLTAAAATTVGPTRVAMARIRAMIHRVPRMLQVAEMAALLTAADSA